MTKFLLLIALAMVIVWLWRKARTARSDEQRNPPPRAAERMVKCSYCGVNQPVSESIVAAGRYYCCAAHRRDGEAKGD